MIERPCENAPRGLRPLSGARRQINRIANAIICPHQLRLVGAFLRFWSQITRLRRKSTINNGGERYVAPPRHHFPKSSKLQRARLARSAGAQWYSSQAQRCKIEKAPPFGGAFEIELRMDYAGKAALACAAMALNASGSCTAKSARTLRSTSIPAKARPLMKRE